MATDAILGLIRDIAVYVFIFAVVLSILSRIIKSMENDCVRSFSGFISKNIGKVTVEKSGFKKTTKS